MEQDEGESDHAIAPLMEVSQTIIYFNLSQERENSPMVKGFGSQLKTAAISYSQTVETPQFNSINAIQDNLLSYIEDIQDPRVPRTQKHLFVQFYLTSLPADAQRLGRAIRQHWTIENQVHWTLDVIFCEDACRIRSFHSPRNLALLRRLALNALNQETSFKRSLRQKSQQAAMNNDYMITVLNSCKSSLIEMLLP